MRVFISYSTGDLSLVSRVANALQPVGEVFYWDESKIPGKDGQIYEWIDQSDATVAIVTDKTVSRAMAVGNEIRRAKAKDKTIIPLAAADVPASELGCLSNVTYQQIGRHNPGPAVASIAALLTAKKKELEICFLVLILLGVVGLIWLLANR